MLEHEEQVLPTDVRADMEKKFAAFSQQKAAAKDAGSGGPLASGAAGSRRAPRTTDDSGGSVVREEAWSSSHRPPASYYNDAGELTFAEHCCSEGAAGKPHSAICNRRSGVESNGVEQPFASDDTNSTFFIPPPQHNAPPPGFAGGSRDRGGAGQCGASEASAVTSQRPGTFGELSSAIGRLGGEPANSVRREMCFAML